MGKVKIFSRVSQQNYEKLEQIKEEYGFRSVYQIVQSLVHTFLDKVESKNLNNISADEEIENMFEEFSNFEKPSADVRYVTPTRTPHYRCDGKES